MALKRSPGVGSWHAPWVAKLLSPLEQGLQVPVAAIIQLFNRFGFTPT